MTLNIQSEVETHLSILDQLGGDMDGARSAMSGTMDRFKRALETRGSRSLCYVMGGVVVLFFVVRLIL